MNNILGYYLMPHPPIIIPSIGKGEELKIKDTSDALNAAADEIKKLNPETIVIITPHGPMFQDACSISYGEKISGNLRNFGCSDLNINFAIDIEFCNKLHELCVTENIPTGLITSKLLKDYHKEFTLDHGSIIPLYFITKKFNNFKIVHITYSFIGATNLYKLGCMIQRCAENLSRKIVVIASGDLSHKLKEDGPYSYSPYGPKFDQDFLSYLSKGNLFKLFAMDPKLINQSGQCGLNSVYVLLGTLNGYEFKGNIISYQGPFGVGYSVIRFTRGNQIQSTREIFNEVTRLKRNKYETKIHSGNIYTRLARNNLIHYFKYNTIIDLNTIEKTMDISDSEKDALFSSSKGVFVSLKKYGLLRGCIGTIYPATNSVAQEIINNSIDAALNDPRFPSLKENELIDLDISVDLLSKPINACRDELNPSIYGVIVSKGLRRGLLLPNLDGIDTVEKQLKIACDKGEINYYKEDFKIEKFEVVRYEEE